MRRTKTKCICASVVVLVIFIFYFFGTLDHISEESFSKQFDYPLNVNILPLVEQIRFGIEPNIDPINYYDYAFYSPLELKCHGRLRLVILVKSAMEHFDRRSVIRRTWGLEDRFEDYSIKTVFFLGIKESDVELQERIDKEILANNDIVQSKFIDAYFNNTIKTMMAFRWAYEYCPGSDFYLFSDDDMLISVKNLLKFLEDPAYYPDVRNLQRPPVIHSVPARIPAFNTNSRRLKIRALNANKTLLRKTLKVKEVAVESFFAGFVFKSSPHRHMSSKWRVTLEEYPYDMWPPYVTAGAYVLSNEAMKNIYAASLFVKHFRFDDIYLGIVAFKLGIVPFHCKEFYFYKKTYSIKNYHNLIASHGYGNPEELKKIWMAQLTGGKV